MPTWSKNSNLYCNPPENSSIDIKFEILQDKVVPKNLETLYDIADPTRENQWIYVDNNGKAEKFLLKDLFKSITVTSNTELVSGDGIRINTDDNKIKISVDAGYGLVIDPTSKQILIDRKVIASLTDINDLKTLVQDNVDRLDTEIQDTRVTKTSQLENDANFAKTSDIMEVLSELSDQINSKQNRLISGSNLSTINGRSLLTGEDIVAVGPKGEKGEKGEKGDRGPQGEKGEQGDKGEKGDAGLNGKDGKQGEQGPKGDKGDKGDAFTYSDFTSEQLEALKGPQGEKGLRGPQGPKGDKGDQGTSGKSAYQLAKDQGYSGTEQEWLQSLKGEKGQTGNPGLDGKDGAGIKDIVLSSSEDVVDTYEIIYTQDKPATTFNVTNGRDGEKGDPLRYTDLTEDQKAELKAPASKIKIEGDIYNPDPAGIIELPPDLFNYKIGKNFKTAISVGNLPKDTQINENDTLGEILFRILSENPVQPTYLSLSADNIQVVKENTTTIQATVLPENVTYDISWSVDQENIIEITPSGTHNSMLAIKAINVGTVKITASIRDKSAECTVTVIGAEPLSAYYYTGIIEPHEISEDWIREDLDDSVKLVGLEHSFDCSSAKMYHAFAFNKSLGLPNDILIGSVSQPNAYYYTVVTINGIDYYMYWTKTDLSKAVYNVKVQWQ